MVIDFRAGEKAGLVGFKDAEQTKPDETNAHFRTGVTDAMALAVAVGVTEGMRVGVCARREMKFMGS
jgi:hypothetical protein